MLKESVTPKQQDNSASPKYMLGICAPGRKEDTRPKSKSIQYYNVPN